MSKSPIKTSYQGLVPTDNYVYVHFNVGNGSWMRHEKIAVPIAELLTDEVTQRMDRHVRKRLIEIWGGQSTPGLFDEAPWLPD